MTLVVAIEHKDQVFMGCDSMMSDAHTKDIFDRPKIIKKEGILFGYSGNFILDNLIRFSLQIPKGEKNEDWLYTQLLPKIREHFGEKPSLEGDALIVISGKVYHLQEDFSIVRSKRGYISIGSGNEVAFGALHATKELLPEDRIRIALEAASEYILSVGGPFHYMVI